MTRSLTIVISFNSVWINKTGRVGQQKLKILYLEMVLVMPGSRKWSRILKSFVQRISDIHTQKWFLDINESPKLSTYSQFKSLREPEKYLYVTNSFWARKQFEKFRTSNHDLAIEKGRHTKLERHMRTCTMCDLGCVEDEYQFTLICPKYDRLREKHLPWRFRNFPSSAKFIDFMSSNSGQTVISLSTFIYQAFKVQKQTDAPVDRQSSLPGPIPVSTVFYYGPA